MCPRWLVVEESDPESRQAVFAWLVRLRWVAILGVALVLLLAGPVFHRLPAGSARWLWTTVAGLSAYNALLALSGPLGLRPWHTFVGQITVDCIALATLVHFAGGLDNPFLPLFVLHVVSANIVLSGRAALGVLALAIVLVAVVVVGEGTGLLPHYCLQPAAAQCDGVTLDLRSLAALGGLVLTLVASSLLTRSLTARLRLGRRHLQATVAELTAEKQQLADTRGAIEAERVRLQAIIDCMGDAVILLDPGGRLLFSNQQARELWRSETPSGDIQPFGALLAEIERGAAPGAAVAFRHHGRAYEATRLPVHSSPGEMLGFVLVARDITDRVAMEKRFMHDEQMSVVGKLAAVVAHEINNPIGVVVLYSQHALAALPPESPVHQHLEIIRRNADSCRTIVEGLLRLARPPRSERRPVDLRDLCRETVDSIRPLALRAGVRISEEERHSGVPLWAQADAGMLHQAVLNLAVNAIEAAGEGNEVFIGAYETQDRDVTAQTIEVRDTGAGIAPDDIEQVFQPFFTTKSSGTGLGLSVAENIVKSHDGRIEVESAVGAGTTFRIVLPDRSYRA